MPTNKKYGRLPKREDDRNLMMMDYVTVALPPAPSKFAWLPFLQWLMLGNDVAGDCTIAGIYHAVMLWLAFVFTKFLPTTTDALSVYTTVTAEENNGNGYNVSTGANDDGCNMQDVLTYVKNTGINGHTIIGYAALNPQDFTQVKTGIMLFGCVYFGINVPAYLEPLFNDNTQIWRVATAGQDTSSVGGHAIIAVKYDDIKQLITFISWGEVYQMEYALFTQICDEAYAVLSQDFISKQHGTTITGFDLTQLQADLSAIENI